MSHKQPETAHARGPHRVDEAKRGHREFMKVLTEVEACVDSSPDRDGVWIGRMREALPMLRESLERHFQGEESGTLYERMPLAFPHLTHRFESLKGEHPVILETTDEIIGKADRLAEPELYELRELDAHVQLLIARIRRHEAAENELIFEAVWHEVGVGD